MTTENSLELLKAPLKKLREVDFCQPLIYYMCIENNFKPSYSLKNIKTLLRINHFQVNPDVAQYAYDDFGWGQSDIVKCLSKLNDKNYRNNNSKNHFYKSEPHTSFPNTMMDYYKIENAAEGNKVYTHFYIHPVSGKLIISSFKEL